MKMNMNENQRPIPASEFNLKLIEHVVQHGSDITFTEAFWKQCEPNAIELRQFEKYVQVLRLFAKGDTPAMIGKSIHVNSGSIWAWTRFREKPKLGHYLQEYLRLGPPKKGHLWMSINNTSRHGVPLGPIVQIPLRITDWSDLEPVLSSIQTTVEANCSFSKEYLFGFLLGMIIGDCAKKRQRSWHRLIELVLSKRYPTNLQIGNFTSNCARRFGLRMRRMPDQKAYGTKPNGFYVWRSQSSALVDWIFNVCLGLDDGQLTTYDPVNMEWATNAPEEFRRGLIQGLAESDGSVNISGQEVEFWIGPSWDFVHDLLMTFGIHSFRSREALAISKNEVAKSLRIPIFAPHLGTIRYQKFLKLATAKHLGRGMRIPSELAEEVKTLAKQGLSIPEISERILDTHGIILTYEATQRWARRA
jgi:hypothetical protein